MCQEQNSTTKLKSFKNATWQQNNHFTVYIDS